MFPRGNLGIDIRHGLPAPKPLFVSGWWCVLLLEPAGGTATQKDFFQPVTLGILFDQSLLRLA
jgi:hypothetical protein